ncbi:MAG: LAGLIDADG family homing endonuclease [Nanoarchaeota archaeon]
MQKIGVDTRIKAYDIMNEMRGKGLEENYIIDKINKNFGLTTPTLKDWFSNRKSPYKRGIKYNKELFYVLGALLGDGCIYQWRNEHQIWLIGDYNFTSKYSSKISLCIGRKVKNYAKGKRNHWFVKISNIELYNLFKEIRQDYKKLLGLILKGEIRENSLQFIEGFFDAEGCVKIIKESVRKTPKICLDITNVNYQLLEIVRNLIKENLQIEARYSIQKADSVKNKQMTYHLRIYKKRDIKRFFDNISTTKLKPEKIIYVENWLNNGK